MDNLIIVLCYAKIIVQLAILIDSIPGFSTIKLNKITASHPNIPVNHNFYSDKQEYHAVAN
jgi:hypothetical protein